MKTIETFIPFKLLVIPEEKEDIEDEVSEEDFDDEVKEASTAFASVLERRRKKNKFADLNISYSSN